MGASGLQGAFIVAISVGLLLGWANSCEMEHSHNGCKIDGNSCSCGFGCKTEYRFRTRRECMDAYRERSSNICYRKPCLRGTCLQTAGDPGFACRCEGTGYYGHRCEKACSTRGMVFNHECIVI